MITQSELKNHLHYNSETGFFTWVRRSQGRRFGCVAGCLDASTGYVFLMVEGEKYRAHRLAWFYVYGVWPKELDHINHIRSDNRIENLREVTRRENQRNRSLMPTNTSGVCGVYWYKASKNWRAGIRVNGKYVHLGCFSDKHGAITARKSADIKYGYHENHGK